MKNIFALLAWAWCLLYLFSCSPAKQLQKQNTAIENLKNQFESERSAIEQKAITKYLEENPSIYPALNTDSICAYYCSWQASQNNASDYFDAVEIKGDTIKKSGPAAPAEKKQAIVKNNFPPCKPVYIPVVDQRLTKIYKDTIQAMRIREASFTGQILTVIQYYNVAGKKQKQKSNKWKLLFFASIALGAVRLILKYGLKIKWL